MHLTLLIANPCFQGTKKIEGILLNQTTATAKPIQLAAEVFRKMNQLRLLIVKNRTVKLSQDFELPCHDLTYFCWHGYTLESMPSNFHADNLVELDLQFSKIKYLWTGNVVLLLFSYIYIFFLWTNFKSFEVCLLKQIFFCYSVLES